MHTDQKSILLTGKRKLSRISSVKNLKTFDKNRFTSARPQRCVARQNRLTGLSTLSKNRQGHLIASRNFLHARVQQRKKVDGEQNHFGKGHRIAKNIQNQPGQQQQQNVNQDEPKNVTRNLKNHANAKIEERNLASDVRIDEKNDDTKISGSKNACNVFVDWEGTRKREHPDENSGSDNKISDLCLPKVAKTCAGATLLAGRYLFTRKIEGTIQYYCIDMKTMQILICGVASNPCDKLLAAYLRLGGHPNINSPKRVIQMTAKSFLFFNNSQLDLLTYVRKSKRILEPEAKQLFRQICSIVKTCHEQGIILRDLKLRKFAFSDLERKHLRLESLEDVVLLDDPTNDVLEEKRGCPVYVAPEILKANRSYCGKAADMWSVGVILYTMVVGRYPFNDPEHSGLFTKISRGLFHLPEVLSPKLCCMIRALLRVEPEERLTSEDILYHPWLDEPTETLLSSPADHRVPDVILD